MDDPIDLNTDEDKGVDWHLEKKYRIQLKEYLVDHLYKKLKILDEEDIVMIADVDEIPHPEILWHLKYCETKYDKTNELIFSGG